MINRLGVSDIIRSTRGASADMRARSTSEALEFCAECLKSEDECGDRVISDFGNNLRLHTQLLTKQANAS